MAWQWHPKAWKGIADRLFSPAVGSSDGWPEWARRAAKRQKPPSQTAGWANVIQGKKIRGCQQCYDFAVHDHFERWERFRAKPGERIALAMGDLFDPERSDEAIKRHITLAGQRAWCDKIGGMWVHREENPATFLIQTRHVRRAIFYLSDTTRDWWELGTSLTGPEDIDNVRALGELPPSVKRFVAIEPVNYWVNASIVGWLDAKRIGEICAEGQSAMETAKPDWVYIGLATPIRKIPEIAVAKIRLIASGLQDAIGCKVIYKKSCGPELWARNEGVTLP